MKIVIKAVLVVAPMFASTSMAFADSCPEVGGAFSSDVLNLANAAAQVDALWDQIADNSDASRRAEELKDDTRRFHGVMFREDCDDLVEDFQEIRQDFARLRAAVDSDPQLNRRRDVALALNGLLQKISLVARRVARLG